MHTELPISEISEEHRQNLMLIEGITPTNIVDVLRTVDYMTDAIPDTLYPYISKYFDIEKVVTYFTESQWIYHDIVSFLKWKTSSTNKLQSMREAAMLGHPQWISTRPQDKETQAIICLAAATVGNLKSLHWLHSHGYNVDPKCYETQHPEITAWLQTQRISIKEADWICLSTKDGEISNLTKEWVLEKFIPRLAEAAQRPFIVRLFLEDEYLSFVEVRKDCDSDDIKVTKAEPAGTYKFEPSARFLSLAYPLYRMLAQIERECKESFKIEDLWGWGRKCDVHKVLKERRFSVDDTYVCFKTQFSFYEEFEFIAKIGEMLESVDKISVQIIEKTMKSVRRGYAP